MRPLLLAITLHVHSNVSAMAACLTYHIHFVWRLRCLTYSHIICSLLQARSCVTIDCASHSQIFPLYEYMLSLNPSLAELLCNIIFHSPVCALFLLKINILRLIPHVSLVSTTRPLWTFLSPSLSTTSSALSVSHYRTCCQESLLTNITDGYRTFF